MLPVRGGERFLRAVFEPLGYAVEADAAPARRAVPRVGREPVLLRDDRQGGHALRPADAPLRPDPGLRQRQKHYFVGEDEMEKLLARGGGWLAAHPEKEEIARRYLKFRPSLYRQALARLVAGGAADRGRGGRAARRPGRGRPGAAPEPQRAAARGGPGGAPGQRCPAGAGPGLRRGQAAAGTAQGQAVRGDRRHGRVDPLAGDGPGPAQAGPAARAAGGPHQADPRLADLPGPAAGGVRRRRRGRGGRAPRPAPAVGLRAGRLRVRPARDGRADDAEPGIQRHVGERRGRSAPAPRPPLRVDASGVPGLGRAGRRAATATPSGSCRSGRWTRRSARRRRWGCSSSRRRRHSDWDALPMEFRMR